jgi:sarcosine oxidase subunit alpha
MADTVVIRVDGKPIRVASGVILAAALAEAGVHRFRRSVQGGERGPLCGMGICFECRVSIDGHRHRRSCLALCAEGMEVRTDE